MTYQAPLTDMQFVLLDVLDVGNLHQFDKYTDASPDLITAILGEMGRFATEVIQPTNDIGDRQGCSYDPQTHVVTTPDGFKAAYRQFVEAGWTALDAPVEWGGQGLPHVLKFVVDEIVCSTNLSLGMYPGLTHGTISAIHAHGSDELKQTYLEKLISGQWSGTMCLTEPQCGTDLGMLRTRATPQDDADPIMVHPDVRRMLMRQKVLNEGMRALALFTGHQLGFLVAHPDKAAREAADDLVQLLTPVVKAFLTDEGFNNANVGLQVLGGAGFTTDWPLEQLVRDSRITRIYEGTKGIQAMDLVGRKLSLAGGRIVGRLFELLKSHAAKDGVPYADELNGSIVKLEQATLWIAENGPVDPDQAGAAATPYLRLVALTMLAYLWSRMAAKAHAGLQYDRGNRTLLEAKLVSAQYYFEKLLPETEWLLRDVTSGKDSMMALADEHWAA